jgi:hypothetical protein
MSLTSRVEGIERKHAPTGRVRCFVVWGKAELKAKEAELKNAPNFNPKDTLVFLNFTH